MASTRTRSQTNRVFLLSGLDVQERKSIGKLITELGGLYLNSDSFRQNCTHVICGKLSRSEKFLGACSMGKWVLHPDYIKQSVKYKSWLQEELFEWSNYDEPNLPIDLKSAGSRWRFNYEVFQTFPFSGWNVAVVVSGAKKCSVYRRLLASGGAKVFNLKLPVNDISKVASILTYIFVNERNASNVLHLVEYGVLCLRPEYIGDYLVKDPTPDPMDYLVRPNTSGVDVDTTVMDINLSLQDCTSTLDYSETGTDDFMGFLPLSQSDQSDISAWNASRDLDILSSQSYLTNTPDSGRLTGHSFLSAQSSKNSTPDIRSYTRVTRNSSTVPSAHSSRSNTSDIESVSRVTRHSQKMSSAQSSKSNTPDYVAVGSKRSLTSLSNNSSQEVQKRVTRKTLRMSTQSFKNNARESYCVENDSEESINVPFTETEMEIKIGQHSPKFSSSLSSRSDTPDELTKRITRQSSNISSTQSSESNTPEKETTLETNGKCLLKSDKTETNSATPTNESARRVVRKSKHQLVAQHSGLMTPDTETRWLSNQNSINIPEEVSDTPISHKTTVLVGSILEGIQVQYNPDSLDQKASIETSTPIGSASISNESNTLEAFSEYVENIRKVTPRNSLRLRKERLTRSKFYTENSTKTSGNMKITILKTSNANEDSSAVVSEKISPISHLVLKQEKVGNIDNLTIENKMTPVTLSTKLEGSMTRKMDNNSISELPIQNSTEKTNTVDFSSSINLNKTCSADAKTGSNILHENYEPTFRNQSKLDQKSVILSSDSKSEVELVDSEVLSDKEKFFQSKNQKQVVQTKVETKSARLIEQNKKDIFDCNRKDNIAHNSMDPVKNVLIDTEKDCSIIDNTKPGCVNVSESLSLASKVSTKRKIHVEEGVGGNTKRIKVYDDKFHWLPAVGTFNSFVSIEDREILPKVEETATQFSVSLSNIILTCLDESSGQQFVAAGLEVFRSSVTAKKHPDPALLNLLVTRILMNKKTSELLANRTYCVLMKVLQYHPPTTLVAINMYNESLAYTIEQDYCENRDWIFVKNTISDVIHENIQRRNGLCLLRFLVAVLEQNYSFVIDKYKDSMCSIQKLKSSMLGQLLWSSLNQIFFNSRCRDLLGYIEEVTSVSIPYEEKCELLKLLLSLYGMAANLCYLVETYTSKQPANVAIFGTNVSSFLHEITKIMSYRLDDVVLKEILMLLQPSWFCLGVCCYLLADYDDYLLVEGLPKERISFRDVVAKYFYLLPKMTSRPADLMKSPHKKRLNKSRLSTPKQLGLSQRSASTPQKPLSSSQWNTPDKTLKKLTKTINKRNCKGEGPLHTACIRNDIIKLNNLLKVSGVDVNIRDNAGWTPMHEACNHGHVQCVKALLQFVPAKTVDHYFSKGGPRCKKVDLLLANDEGITPLHDAVLNNRNDICQLLLQHAGSVLLKQKTILGYTPMDLAANDDLRDLLLSYTDDPLAMTSSQENSQGQSIPGSHLYDQVLGQGQQMKCTSADECAKYVSIISFLISSYISAMDMTNKSINHEENGNKENCTGQFKSEIDRDLKSDVKILLNLEKYIHRFEEHVKKICDYATSERLEMELAMLMCLQCNDLRVN